MIRKEKRPEGEGADELKAETMKRKHTTDIDDKESYEKIDYE